MQKGKERIRLKAKKWIWLLPVIAVLCLMLILGLARLRRTTDAQLPAQLTEGVALTVGQREVTVADLSYYYWSEYYYYIHAGISPQPDGSRDLAQQAYDADTSWYDYFLSAAIRTAREDLALCEAGRAAGFTLPEQWKAELEAVKARFSEYAAAGGFFLAEDAPDVEGYLQSSYGAQATSESFFRHLEEVYYAAAYADSLYYDPEFSEEEVQAFFTLHRDRYEAEGLRWDEACPVRVAWALFVPQEKTEQAAQAAYDRAETMALAWHAAGGGEEAFVQLGEALSFDTAETAADRWIAPMRLLPSDRTDTVLSDWCFDPVRQIGDYTITRTLDGWALVFFAGRELQSEARLRAEEDLRYETYRSACKQIVESVSFAMTEDKIVIAEPLQDEK